MKGNLIFWLLGVIFFIIAFSTIKHFSLFILFGLIGFILIPSGHKYIERTLRFNLTIKIKTITTGLLFITTLPIYTHYDIVDKQEAHKQALLDKERKRQEVLALNLEQQRVDSFNYYLKKTDTLLKNGDLKTIEKFINLGYKIALGGAERQQVDMRNNQILSIQADGFIRAKKYKIALEKLNQLTNFGESDPDLTYNIAFCLSKLGETEEAVNYLKPLLAKGDKRAGKLHNKINPIRRKLEGYITRCCDGTTSNARGRGACSWHGGVCNWNEPVYQESRKYE